MPLLPPPRARHAAALAALLTLATYGAPAAAQPSFDYGAISVSAKRYLDGSLVAQDDDLAPAGNPALASVLHQFGIAPFPTSGSTLPRGYASAVMTGTGFGGVGVSFVSGGRPDYGSFAQWTQDITNVGNLVGRLEARFDIPRMEASIMAGAPYGPFPTYQAPLAQARASLVTTRFAEDGTQLSRTTIFDYLLRIERRFQGDLCPDISKVTVSDDLSARLPGALQVIDVLDVCGVATIPFGGTISLGVLGAGERLVVDYELSAENLAWRSLTPELGYQALVGDPFAVSGQGGIVVRSATVAAVPEPATVTLLGLGLAALGACGIRRRRDVAGLLSTG